MMRDLLKEWQLELFEEYMVFRKRAASCAASTQETIQAAIFSFFIYMNEHGICSLADVSAPALKDWHMTSPHSSARARNLYTAQLRLFFEYLEDRKMLLQPLSLALTHQSAPLTTIVEVFSPKQLEIVENYRLSASTPMELRDAAMVMLGLKMGLRSVDIQNLRIPDISWKKQTIAFEQQKTGVFVTLPMPTVVGNSLYRYIMEGRPKNDECNQVFLSHMPPYDGLRQTVAIRRSLMHIFRHSDTGMPCGFHITRRTFASELLRTGSPMPLIASALGHATVCNVNSYLSTDEKNLRKCAIGCDGISYKGAYGL